MQRQLTQLLTRLKLNVLYIILAFYSIFKGTALLTKKHPQFYFPPEFKGLMNSPYFQWALVIVGILMIVYIVSKLRNNVVTGILLSISVGLTTILVLIEAEHLYFRGDYGPQLVSDLTVLAFAIWIARHRSKR